MALAARKTLFFKNIPMVKYTKKRTMVSLANKINPSIIKTIQVKSPLLQCVQTLKIGQQVTNGSLTTKVPTKFVSNRLESLKRSASLSSFKNNRATNGLTNAKSAVNLTSSLTALPYVSARTYYTVNLNFKDQEPRMIRQYPISPASNKQAFSTGQNKGQDFTQSAPEGLCPTGPCNCPWPGGCAPPGFNNNAGMPFPGPCGPCQGGFPAGGFPGAFAGACPSGCQGGFPGPCPPGCQSAFPGSFMPMQSMQCNPMPCPLCGACGSTDSYNQCPSCVQAQTPQWPGMCGPPCCGQPCQSCPFQCPCPSCSCPKSSDQDSKKKS